MHEGSNSLLVWLQMVQGQTLCYAQMHAIPGTPAEFSITPENSRIRRWRYTHRGRLTSECTHISLFSSIMATVFVIMGCSSLLLFPSCWLRGLQAAVHYSKEHQQSGVIWPCNTWLDFLLSSWLAALVSMLTLADLP